MDQFLEAAVRSTKPMQPAPAPVVGNVTEEFTLGCLSKAEARQYERTVVESLSSAQLLHRIDELVKEYLDDIDHGVVLGENLSPQIIRRRLFREFPGTDRKEIEWQIQRSLTRHQQVRDAGK